MPDLPSQVTAVCETFLASVPDGLVTGLYLRGGVGFGEWVPGHSDVDFFATLARRPDTADIAALRSAHEAVAATHPGGPHFDGAHVLVSDLASDPRECPDVPTVGVGKFHEGGPHEISVVGWHELARHGVTVAGPPLETLDIWTDDEVLRAYTIGNLDTYWRQLAEACAAAPLEAAKVEACEWVVPGVARLHHLLETGEQTTKSRAVRWGLDFYAERFHRVLRESLRLREGAFDSQYVILAERGDDVTAFVSYVVEVNCRG